MLKSTHLSCCTRVWLHNIFSLKEPLYSQQVNIFFTMAKKNLEYLHVFIMLQLHLRVIFVVHGRIVWSDLCKQFWH